MLKIVFSFLIIAYFITTYFILLFQYIGGQLYLLRLMETYKNLLKNLCKVGPNYLIKTSLPSSLYFWFFYL